MKIPEREPGLKTISNAIKLKDRRHRNIDITLEKFSDGVILISRQAKRFNAQLLWLNEVALVVGGRSGELATSKDKLALATSLRELKGEPTRAGHIHGKDTRVPCASATAASHCYLLPVFLTGSSASKWTFSSLSANYVSSWWNCALRANCYFQ